jgi:hypothetical protein
MDAIAELESFFAEHRFVYLGLFALNCYGLARHIPFEVLVLRDYGPEDSWAASQMGADIISLEQETHTRVWGSGVAPLLEEDVGSRVSAALTSDPHRRYIVVSSAVKQVEVLAAGSGGRLQPLAPPAAIAGPLGDKSALRRILPSLGIEPIPHEIVDLAKADFSTIERRFGLPSVVQLPTGAGGSGTFFIRTPRELRSLQERLGTQDVIVSKFISGFAPNINAVVLDDSVLLSYPSVQLVGVPECTPLEGGYCGNDFSATQRLPNGAVQTIYDQTCRIGGWMGEQGFRGMWGIDFVVDGSRVYPVEVNARFQGSTRLLTELQYLDGQAPLVLSHVASFLEGGQALVKRLSAHWRDPQPLVGSQIDLKSLEQDWSVVRGSLRYGVYEWNGSAGIYRREGITIADCKHPDEFVLTGTVPRVGTRVQPGAVVLRIQTLREVLGERSNQLLPWAVDVCKWVYRVLDLA